MWNRITFQEHTQLTIVKNENQYNEGVSNKIATFNQISP
jgi:hypothetical protein